MSKFRYTIDKNRIYTLTYDDVTLEVTGEYILSLVYKEAYLSKLFYEDFDQSKISGNQEEAS